MEVEFLVTDAGEVYVLEINPRVSGTLRIAAMACHIRVFDLFDVKTHEDFQATRFALELPHDGRSPEAVHEDVVASSRLTVASYQPKDVFATLIDSRVFQEALMPALRRSLTLAPGWRDAL
jgi:biotin carboxylase